MALDVLPAPITPLPPSPLSCSLWDTEFHQASVAPEHFHFDKSDGALDGNPESMCARSNGCSSQTLIQSRPLKRKLLCDDYRPTKRLSPLFNTPKQRKDERRKVLRISLQKLRKIDDAELMLCRSVLINNTVKKLQREGKEEKANGYSRSMRLFGGEEEVTASESSYKCLFQHHVTDYMSSNHGHQSSFTEDYSNSLRKASEEPQESKDKHIMHVEEAKCEEMDLGKLSHDLGQPIREEVEMETIESEVNPVHQALFSGRIHHVPRLSFDADPETPSFPPHNNTETRIDLSSSQDSVFKCHGDDLLTSSMDADSLTLVEDGFTEFLLHQDLPLSSFHSWDLANNNKFDFAAKESNTKGLHTPDVSDKKGQFCDVDASTMELVFNNLIKVLSES